MPTELDWSLAAEVARMQVQQDWLTNWQAFVRIEIAKVATAKA